MANPFQRQPEFDTIQVHGGQAPDTATNARAVPIYATASFVFNDFSHGADLSGLRAEDHIYSRISNPTVAVVEERIAALEGGVAAVAVSSGLAAQFLAISAIADAGDNIVSTNYLYGGTYVQFKATFKKFGIGVKWVTEVHPEAFVAAIDEKTKAIYVESIANPKLILSNIPVLAKIAHDHGIPLIVDNTFGMAGYLIKPIEYGADIVVHSATKWICGHGTTIAGVVVDSGKFNWTKSGKFPAFTELADGYYYGLKLSATFGAVTYATMVRELLCNLGPALNPFGAFLLLQGLETLSLRGQRHCENALALASYLKKHPQVAWVSYLGLESHQSHALANKLLRSKAYGGVLSFGVKGDVKLALKVIDRMKLASNLANVGDAKTLIMHPASNNHMDLSPEEQLALGITPDLIRVSVGLEDIKDIIADFEVGLQIAFAEAQ